MNVTKRSHDKYYGRVMPRVYRQSDSSIKPNSLVVRHEIPSVRVGAKPSVSKSSGVFSELPTILNDYVPDLGNGKIKKRSFVAKPRRTIKSLDPAKSPPQRTVKNVSEFGERFNITNVRAHDSDPIVINRIKDNWSNTHLRQCYSSRSHTKLKELKDEIKAYHDTEKNLKFRNNLYKSCGLVLNDGQWVAVDKAVQSESVKTDNDGSEIRSEQRDIGEDARAFMPDEQMKFEQPRYPVDRYLVESSKFEMVNIIDDEIWNPDPALRPEDEIILRKLHDMLQSTADDLRLLSGELSKFHEPGVQAKSLPVPLDEEFNEKVHIEEMVNAKFHGYNIIDKPSTYSPTYRPKNISVDDNTAVVNNIKKPKVLNTGIQVNTMPILKKSTTNRNLSKSRTKILQINETINNENVKYQKLNNTKVLNTGPAVTYNEFSYKYNEPEIIPAKSLQIQEMPSINIRGELREQKILHLDIVPNTKDVEHNTGSESNVAVITMKHEPAPLLEQTPSTNYKQIKHQCTHSSGIVKKEPIRKVSRMSTCDSSETTNNISSEAQHKLKKQKPRIAFKKSLKTSENRKFTENQNRDKKTDKPKRETYKQPHCNVEEWRRKLNTIYGQPSSSRNSKSKSNKNFKKKSPKPISITRPEKHTLNNAEYVPYSQLTLGGVKVSDVEREISDMPNKNDIPLSPILDRILNSRENSFDQDRPINHKKYSPKILTTSDENLLQEVVDIERKISETLSKNVKIKAKEAKTQKLSNANNEVDAESYADDFEDDKSEDSEKSDQSHEARPDPVISDMSSQDNNDNKLSDSNKSDDAKSDSDESNKNIQNTTYTKTPNLTLKNSIDIFEFIHTVDTQDTATQSNTTYKISLKETQTSPRNDRPNLQAIHNDLWPSIDPRGQVEKMFELEKDFIKKLIIDEYGDLLERTITKPSTSKENNKIEKQGRNISESQKNTQTSPAHMKSVMTSPTITKTRTTSPFALSLTVDRHTSPVVLVTNEEDLRVEIQNEPEDLGISINLSSPRFSLRLPQTSNEVLSNLEIHCQSNSNKLSKSNKSKTFTKSNVRRSSSSSVDADKSSSEISSLGEVNLKLQRRLRKYRKPTTSDSSSSSLSKYSSDFQSEVLLPLRSEGEISLGETIKRKTNKCSKSEGEMSLKPL